MSAAWIAGTNRRNGDISIQLVLEKEGQEAQEGGGRPGGGGAWGGGKVMARRHDSLCYFIISSRPMGVDTDKFGMCCPASSPF